MKIWRSFIAFSLIAVVSITAYSAFESDSEIVLDAKNEKTLPKNLRIDNALKTLGSSQFSELQLKEVVASLNAPVVIVDLRQETHDFVNGNAVSWMKEKSSGYLPETLSVSNERAFQNKVENSKIASVYRVKPEKNGHFINQSRSTFPLVTFKTEMQLANQLNVPYIRFPVAYQSVPSDKVVDDFVAFSKSVPNNAWVYFHCRDGIKRTNIFLSMYDMIFNAKHESFENILHRDYILIPNSTTALNAKETKFLRHFYNYCHTNNDNYQTHWSDWLRSNET